MKQTIRLTESQLHKVVTEAVKRIVSEAPQQWRRNPDDEDVYTKKANLRKKINAKKSYERDDDEMDSRLSSHMASKLRENTDEKSLFGKFIEHIDKTFKEKFGGNARVSRFYSDPDNITIAVEKEAYPDLKGDIVLLVSQGGYVHNDSGECDDLIMMTFGKKNYGLRENKFGYEHPTYFGIPGTKVIWHGEWSDPEIEYNGMLYNYYDIDDYFNREYQNDIDDGYFEGSYEDWFKSIGKRAISDLNLLVGELEGEPSTYTSSLNESENIGITIETLKKQHDQYNKFRTSGYPLEKLAEKYTMEELALHLLLEEEFFYYKTKDGFAKALNRLKMSYPEATAKDLKNAYEKYKDMVYEIYG